MNNTDTKICPVCETEVSFDHWSLSEHFCDDCAIQLPDDGKVAEIITVVADTLGANVTEHAHQMLVTRIRQELVRDPKFYCSCGETYSSKDAAINCKKCRQYLYSWDFIKRTVRTGNGAIVWSAS